MSKRTIAIDLDGGEVRVAILQGVSGAMDIALHQKPCSSASEAESVLREIFAELAIAGDRTITALPARHALCRRLRFPFREKRKLEAALPLALGSQLPVALDDQLISFMPAEECGDGDYEVAAVAVPRTVLTDALEHFPQVQQHPAIVDLLPFALVPALGEAAGILVCCRAGEVVVALIVDGKVTDYQFLPVDDGGMDDEELFDFVAQQVNQLEGVAQLGELPLWVMGSWGTESLREWLKQQDRRMATMPEDVARQNIPDALVPVVLLGLAHQRTGHRTGQFNFRTGEFAARGQLQILRPKLIAAAVLLVLVCLGTGTGMYLKYRHKASQEAELSQQMTTLFRQVMPPGAAIVNAPLQLESYRQQLQGQVKLFGLDGRGSVAVLQELSTLISTDIQVELQDLTYGANEVRLSGRAGSFEAVNRIAEVLATGELFSDVTIVNARLATDNVRVDFDLHLSMAGGSR